MGSGKCSRRGNSALEFALVGLILVPLFLGTTNIGLNLGRSVQVQQVARDTGHLYVRQLDFSLAKNQQFLARMGQGLGLQVGSGPGVVILSKIQMIGDDECLLGSGTTSCANKDRAVFVQRIVVGNSAVKQSEFGSPNPALVAANGTIASSDYTTDPTTIATGFTNALKNMVAGEVSYLTEVYFEFPEWFMNQGYTSKGVYARSIF
jgi:hypothetical protein